MSYFNLGSSPIEDHIYKMFPIAAAVVGLVGFEMQGLVDAATFASAAVMFVIGAGLLVLLVQRRHGFANIFANMSAIFAAAYFMEGETGVFAAVPVGLFALALAAGYELAYTDPREELQFSGSLILRTLWEAILPASFAAALVLEFSGARGLAICSLALGAFVPFAWAVIRHLFERAADRFDESFA